ncbi:MAG: ECF-type sigma factor [Pseudohongiella sp.]|uniref:ECF-type sigma factor n=1 Tax=Pseudohongiella sp. TaxID=1979412 RepID=UPI0034A0715F
MTDPKQKDNMACSPHDAGFRTGGSWMSKLQTGDESPAALLWQRYHVKLVTLAQQRLSMSPQRLADGDDVVVSAFGSFFRAVHESRVDRNISENELWRLLVTLTARKAIKVLRSEGRQCRDSRASKDSVDMDSLVSDEPGPEFANALVQQYHWLNAQLVDDDMRLLVQLKLEGFSNAEIAQQLDCSVRTVKRRLLLIRTLISQAIDQAGNDEGVPLQLSPREPRLLQ